jgi:hypothetical protein
MQSFYWYRFDRFQHSQLAWLGAYRELKIIIADFIKTTWEGETIALTHN